MNALSSQRVLYECLIALGVHGAHDDCSSRVLNLVFTVYKLCAANSARDAAREVLQAVPGVEQQSLRRFEEQVSSLHVWL